MDEIKSGFCQWCDRRVMVFRRGTNHLLHLILSILTGGLWIIIWIGLAIKIGGWRCVECGSKNVTNVR